ncbi:hypothetical protein BCR33DRAFT_728062 [Rhizoclosmatium globosum]|uniref:Crinkler effector protein N-terminal domain-containing protein n=1 Tax=Rhizoclosmatium globosum TaxID=329046 RepID=A0A1Y2ALU3_9FUNG|nr:hypothetical protein BCR33DRAFT_728062 [Rhizoclosmatium globosum]|eukprot:ORY23452.1 hypothetical protein BCR33DRAFT_728062 [Rhizoclosmatium globosum]
MLCCLIVDRKMKGAVFPVDISPLSFVGHLKDAIKAKKKHDLDRFDADSLTLVRIFTANEGGLKLDVVRKYKLALDLDEYGDFPEEAEDTRSLFSGRTGAFKEFHGSMYKVMDSSQAVLDYVDDMGLPKGLCHVLILVPAQVAPPELVSARRGSVSQLTEAIIISDLMEPVNNPEYQAYCSRGSSLASHKTMIALVHQINRIYAQFESSDKNSIPFVVLETSSGIGKTQTAFTLMSTFKVAYVACIPSSDTSQQKIYSAFGNRTVLYMSCVREDIQNYPFYHQEVSIQILISQSGSLKLSTYAFICALLTGDQSSLAAITRDQALKKLNGKRGVFFMDEFPVHNPRAQDAEAVKFRLRFMRTVVGALGLVGILSSTHSSAMNMFIHGNEASRGGGGPPKLWCYVVPRFPPFEVPSGTDIPDWLRLILENSRPWFSHIALQHYHEYYRGNTSVPDYLDQLFCFLWKEARRSKKFGQAAYTHGQVCLLLSVNHVQYETQNPEFNVIEKHFAQLDRLEMFPLYLSDDGLQNLDETLWIHRVIFPTAEIDLLLHLVFLGGKGYRTFVSTFLEAVQATKNHQTFALSFKNSNVKTNDGLEAEASRFGAVVLASRANGLHGSSFDQWISFFMQELGMVQLGSQLKVPDKIAVLLKGIQVPYLGAPNVSWPKNLPCEWSRFLGEFSRSLNNDRIDGSIGSDITFEVKDWSTSFGTPNLEDALKRKPLDSTAHIILVNKVVNGFYSTKKAAGYSAFVKQHQNLLGKTFLYMLTKKGFLEMKGIKNQCRCSKQDHSDSSCAPQSVVILIPTVL